MIAEVARVVAAQVKSAGVTLMFTTNRSKQRPSFKRIVGLRFFIHDIVKCNSFLLVYKNETIYSEKAQFLKYSINFGFLYSLKIILSVIVEKQLKMTILLNTET